jgi:mannan endo-1,4-beta-mannosidase
MKKQHLFFSILIMVMLLLLPFGQASAADTVYPGYRVEGRFLYDNQGEKVILYGVNKMIVWTDKDGIPSYSEIAKTGANCVRIVWSLDESAADLDTAITNCRAENMIPIIELHNATGEWSKLSSLVDYWVRSDVVEVIQKHQEYLLVNIGNEVGNQVSEADFKTGYEAAVTKMRKAGIHVPLVIDASSYGQNIDILQSCGPSLIEADPDQNLLFSVHMWWPKAWGYTDQRVTDELEETVALNLPLVVGEFGNQWEETDSGQIPYKTIIEQCYKNQIGYLAWSWGPGNNPQTFLDMTTDGTYKTLNGWGLEVAVTNPYSIQNIAQRPASMQSNQPSIKPGRVEFDKAAANQQDVTVTMTTNDNVFNGIKNGEDTLVSGTDYTISDNLVTIKKEYLAKQAVGITKLTFDFNLTNNPVLTVDVSDTSPSSSITPAAAAFAKSIPEDITVTMTLNGNTLLSIQNDSTILTPDTDYSVTDNVVTLKKEYLESLPVGSTALTFAFSSGSDQILKIQVTDTQETNLTVEFYNGTKSTEINTISPKFKLTNTGDEAIALSDVTIRYYYTKDGNQAQSFWCDWSHVGSSNITGTFVTMEKPQTNADCYLEIGFTSAAGNLAANQSIEIQTRIAKADWTNYNQANDYSFAADADSYAAWDKITTYISGVLSSGIEP